MPPTITVQAGLGDTVTCRMPSRAEQLMLSVPEGTPVISVQRAGRAEELFDARAVMVCGGLNRVADWHPAGMGP